MTRIYSNKMKFLKKKLENYNTFSDFERKILTGVLNVFLRQGIISTFWQNPVHLLDNELGSSIWAGLNVTVFSLPRMWKRLCKHLFGGKYVISKKIVEQNDTHWQPAKKFNFLPIVDSNKLHWWVKHHCSSISFSLKISWSELHHLSREDKL